MKPISGRFSIVSVMPRIADSLAERMETNHMLPLAKAEVEGRTPDFLERLFEGKLQSQRNAALGDDLVQLVPLGGFPKAIRRLAPAAGSEGPSIKSSSST